MSKMVEVIDTVDHVDVDTKLIEKIVDKAKKPRIKLNEWSWSRTSLQGFAVNHPTLGNRWIKTSKIIHFDEDQRVAESFNTVYELGTKSGS